jgi:hypothetical protein
VEAPQAVADWKDKEVLVRHGINAKLLLMMRTSEN